MLGIFYFEMNPDHLSLVIWPECVHLPRECHTVNAVVGVHCGYTKYLTGVFDFSVSAACGE